MTRSNQRQRGPRTYSKHGLTMLKLAVKDLGGRVIDMRTTVGKVLAMWRGDLIADLGGPEAISTQQVAVVDLAVKTKLLLDSIDAWLLQQPTLINKRDRALLPVVRERQQLADALARYMGQLGLARRKPPAKNLDQYLEELQREDDGQEPAAAPPKTPEDTVQ